MSFRGLLTLCWTFVLYGQPAHSHTMTTIDAGRGPVQLMIPNGYSPSTPVPLVVSLHGYGGTGESYIDYWKKNGQVDARKFIVAAPSGKKNSKDRSFWNATAACCDKDLSGVDDSQYLRALIEAIETEYTIDPQSIHVTGYSNGGFMAHRMACAHADKLASIVSVAGAGISKESSCNPDHPIHVLQVHGVDDGVIRYQGGGLKNFNSDVPIPHPSALQTVAFWAQKNSGPAQPTTVDPMDLSERTAGIDTEVIRYQSPGRPSGTVELWSIRGESHVPKLNDNFHSKSIDWMLTHRKTSGR